jgi:hypothetical protein
MPYSYTYEICDAYPVAFTYSVRNRKRQRQDCYSQDPVPLNIKM